MRIILLLFFGLLTLPAFTQTKGAIALKQYEEALKHYRSKEFGTALELVSMSLNTQPTADAYYLSGLVHEAQNREIRAVADYEATLQIEPGYREAIFQKGILYLKNGDPVQAIKDFNTLLGFTEAGTTRGVYFEIDPSDGKAVGVLTLENSRARTHYYRGLAYQKVGERANALKDFNAAIELDKSAEFLNARALLYESLGEKKEAVKDLKEATAIAPLNQVAWFNLVRLDDQVQLPEELVNGDLGPTASLLASRAHEEGNNEEALMFYNLALESGQRDALTLINRGRVLTKLTRYEEARKDFTEAKAIDPIRVETLYLIGNTYFFQQQYDRALAFYNEYITVNPLDANVWYNGAISNIKLTNEAEACHYLTKASRLGLSQATQLMLSRCKE